MGVKPGYKQTEAGVIPEDWEVKPLGVLVTALEAGVSVNSVDMGDDAPTRDKSILKTSCVLAGRFFLDERKPIAPRDIHRAKQPLRKDTIVISRMNTPALVGECGYIDQDYPYIFLPDRLWMTKHTTHIPHSVRWLAYLLSFRRFNQAIKSSATGTSGSMKNISKSSLLTVPIPIPPTKPEQEAIAEALSDADALIESVEQLLAKKRNLKQGAMQELLTGKKRLPGFSGKWQLKSLGDLASLSKIGINPASSPQCLFAHYSLPAFDTGKMPVIEEGSRIGSNKFVVPSNAVLLSKLNPRIPRIWAPSYIPENAVCSTEFLVLVPHESTDRDYLLFLCSSPEVCYQMELQAVGTTGSHQRISPMQALEIQVKTPDSVAEQRAIAAVLTDMDAEIAALEAKLGKARQIKTGMMQELLTGRIRLVGSSASLVPSLVRQQAAVSPGKGHNTQINEAVVLALLASKFGTEQYPLARVRRTKLMYLLHRHVERQPTGFLKKAAGPYNPQTRYGGPEKIALKNHYVRAHHNGTYEGFVAADNLSQAEKYFEQWYGTPALEWLEQFRWKHTEDLELLSTVDMASEDLRRESKPVNLSTVKQILRNSAEWKPKLNRPVFADNKIEDAIEMCHKLFPPEGETA